MPLDDPAEELPELLPDEPPLDEPLPDEPLLDDEPEFDEPLDDLPDEPLEPPDDLPDEPDEPDELPPFLASRIGCSAAPPWLSSVTVVVIGSTALNDVGS